MHFLQHLERLHNNLSKQRHYYQLKNLRLQDRHYLFEQRNLEIITWVDVTWPS